MTVYDILTQTPNVVIISAAVIAAIGVIWRKAVKPARDWVRHLKQWMKEIREQLQWVDFQMKPNHGTSLVDKVNMAASKMVETDQKVDRLARDVALLLAHDAERDTAGRRYGPELPEEDT